MGLRDVPEYTLMMFVIKYLTSKIMFVIIVEIDLAKLGETHTANPQEYP